MMLVEAALICNKILRETLTYLDAVVIDMKVLEEKQHIRT